MSLLLALVGSGVSGVGSSAQAQTSSGSGAFLAAIDGVGAGAQAQTTSGAGAFFAAIEGTGVGSQAQSANSQGSLGTPSVSVGGGGFGGGRVREREKPRTRSDDFWDELRTPYQAPVKDPSVLVVSVPEAPQYQTTLAKAFAAALQVPDKPPKFPLSKPARIPLPVRALTLPEEIPDEVYLLALL